MTFNSQDYPMTAEYLGLGGNPFDETQLSNDIDTLTRLLPRFVTLMDEDKSLVMPNIEIGYIILNLKRVRDELRTKGGAL